MNILILPWHEHNRATLKQLEKTGFFLASDNHYLKREYGICRIKCSGFYNGLSRYPYIYFRIKVKSMVLDIGTVLYATVHCELTRISPEKHGGVHKHWESQAFAILIMGNYLLYEGGKS